MKQLIFIFILLFMFSANAEARPGTGVGVHDGDTLVVEWEDGSKDKIRLFGVDCPETEVKGRWETQPYGRKASTFVRELLKKWS